MTSGNFGYSAHKKRDKINGKKIQLRPIPKIAPNQKYTDPTGIVRKYIDYLAYILRISPNCAIARVSNGDVSITSNGLYKDFSQIMRPESNSMEEKRYNSYFSRLYNRKDDLLPESSTTVYKRYSDIPKSKKDPFFRELAASVSATMKKALDIKKENSSSAITEHDKD